MGGVVAERVADIPSGRSLPVEEEDGCPPPRQFHGRASHSTTHRSPISLPLCLPLEEKKGRGRDVFEDETRDYWEDYLPLGGLTRV